MFASTIIKIAIERPFKEVYDFIAEPLNFPSWASMPGGKIEPLGDGTWLADVPDGKLVIRFTPHNPFGVLDYQAFVPGSEPEPVAPVRLYPNADGCELIFTRFQLPGVSDARFASDNEWVVSDLERMKSVLESR